MLDDHSSRWSAAASPGGLIGLILTILAVMVLVASILGLTGNFDAGIDETILYAILGISTFLTFVLAYLLISYLTIRYRLDSEKLSITWGLSSVKIPYDEIEAVDPATDVLGEQAGGWTPFWPGYYIGSLNTDLGQVRVVATLPPRRQVLISRSNGDIFAISPERPLLFMEELARWHEQYYAAGTQEEAGTDTARPIPAQEESLPTRGFVSALEPEPSESNIRPAPPLQSPEVYPAEPMGTSEEPARDLPSVPDTAPYRVVQPAPEPDPPTAELRQVAPPVSDDGPVFGAVQAEEDPRDSQPRFGTVAPDVEPSYRPAGAQQARASGDPPPLADPDADTGEIDIWAPEHPPGQEQPPQLRGSFQQFVDAGWTGEYPATEAGQPVLEPPPFSPPKPVIAPAGTPRSQVLQPLTRVQRAERPATSPALRPLIHRDPISLSFIGASALATIAMVLYILIQWDDMPPSLTLHWNADGLPGRVGEPREIWILPLIAGLVLVANVALAWSIAQFDRFAARLMLGSTVIVHLVTWIALLMIL